MTMIKPFAFNSLRSRLTALLITPVVVILLAAGVAGFIYIRDAMLDQNVEAVQRGYDETYVHDTH